MKTIAIVVGHGPSVDKGAWNQVSGVSELDWNKELARQISIAIGPRAVAVIVAREVERQPPIDRVNRLNPICAVELHLNAYNGTASGTEMIHYPGSVKGEKLARLLQSAAVGVLKLPDRGVKGPQAGGRGMAFLAKTHCPAVIIESFFIDNNADLQVGNLRKAALAKSYADALCSFAS